MSPIPAGRTPVRIARGNLADLQAGLSALEEGEITWAEDLNRLYVVKGTGGSAALTSASPADATTASAGLVRLADAAAIAAGTAGRVVDAAQLQATVISAGGNVDATTSIKGIVLLADAAAITAGTAGRVVDAAQLKAAAPPDGSQTVKGLMQLATPTETTNGALTTKAVHPAGLKVELDKCLRANIATLPALP